MTLAHTTSGATEAEACQALAVAVIHQALLDATRTSLSPSTAMASDVETARCFLLNDGEWRMSRDFWCEHAGLEPAWLDRRVRALQAEGKL